MDSPSKQYEGPALSIHLTATAKAYQWKIEMIAADHTGIRSLGYRAEGFIPDLNAEPGEFPIKVHDENRAVWTEMLLSDRKDIRAIMSALLSASTAAMMKAVKQS